MAILGRKFYIGSCKSLQPPFVSKSLKEIDRKTRKFEITKNNTISCFRDENQVIPSDSTAFRS